VREGWGRARCALWVVGLAGCVRVGAVRPAGANGAGGVAAPSAPGVSVASAAIAADSCPATRGQAVLEIVNLRRVAEGLGPLEVDPRLVAAAQAHAEDLFGHPGVPAHAGSDGSDPGVRAARRDYPWVRIGENVASGTPSASTVVALWMNSRGHRHNILTPEFRDAGVGVVDPPAGSSRGTYWVMEYGRTEDAGRLSVRCHP